MKELVGTLGKVDIYFLGGLNQAASASAWDFVVPNKTTAFGAYYEVEKFPRFRVTHSENLAIDHSKAPDYCAEFHEWLRAMILDDNPIIDGRFYIFGHNLSPDEFMAWDLQYMSNIFMAVNGCSFTKSL